MIFSGLVAMELVNFDPTQTIRDPCPERVIVQLHFKEQMSPTQVQEQLQNTGRNDPERSNHTPDPNKWDIGFWAQLRIPLGHDDTTIPPPHNHPTTEQQQQEDNHENKEDSLLGWDAYYTLDTMVLVCHSSTHVEYDVMMLTIGHPVLVTSSGDPIPLPTSSRWGFPNNGMMNFLESLTLYGWLHGDCILGLMKNNRSQTGSFYMQLRNCNRLGMLGLKRALEDTGDDRILELPDR
mmetsp:Transcript_19645/g.22082  ORF Transcript_19645/g.22082 Transcript_19645/m.22082 type:complete len:236 (+) Transcript_19645:1-708(+)